MWAFRHCGRWDRVREICDDIIALREVTQYTHDDIELERLHAGWHLGDNYTSLLEQSARCATEDQATAEHRIRATRIAILLANNLGEIDVARRVFFSVRSLLEASWLDSSECLHVRMSCERLLGSLQEASRCAQALVEAERQSGSIPRLVHALRASAELLYEAGNSEQSRLNIQEGFELAQKQSMGAAAVYCAEQMATLELNEGSLDRAVEWIGRGERWSARIHGKVLNENLRCLKARVVLEQGHVAHALELLKPYSVDGLVDSPAIRGTAGFLAVIVQCLPTTEPDFRKSLQALERIHAILQRLGRVDYSTFGLFRGLVRAGRTQDACEMLDAYVTHHRRDQSRHPFYVLRALAEASALSQCGAVR
jgi:hypothetical protein